MGYKESDTGRAGSHARHAFQLKSSSVSGGFIMNNPTIWTVKILFWSRIAESC